MIIYRTYYHLLDQLFTKKHNLQERERIKGKFAFLIYINIYNIYIFEG